MRLIDADALIDFIDCGHLRNPLESCFSERDVVDMLESRPTIDAVPVVRGEWEVAIGYDPNKKVQCQNCYKMAYEPTPYCPNCGAKMTGENGTKKQLNL